MRLLRALFVLSSLLLLCVCSLVRADAASDDSESSGEVRDNNNNGDERSNKEVVELVRFGDKLMRRKISRRRSGESLGSEEESVEIQLPEGGVKAPSGKTLSKMVVRTFKTTTSTSTTSTTEKPKSQHYWNHYYPNRNKKKVAVSTTTTTSRTPESSSTLGSTEQSRSNYSFPPYSKSTIGGEKSHKNKEQHPRQYVLRSSFATQTPTKSTSNTTPYRTTYDVTSTTTAVPTTTTTIEDQPTTQQYYYEDPSYLGEGETTTTTEAASTAAATVYPTSTSSRRPVKVISKTLSTVVTSTLDSSYGPAKEQTEELLQVPKKLEEEGEVLTISTTKKPIHYILAVIGPTPTDDPSSTLGTEQDLGEVATSTESPSEETSTSTITTTPIPPTTSTKGPFDHLQLVSYPPIIDNSPPIEVIASVGNTRPFFRLKPPPPPSRYNYFQDEQQSYSNSFKDLRYRNNFHRDQHQHQQQPQPQLIPLQTIVTYDPQNGRTVQQYQRNSVGNSSPGQSQDQRSPFVSAKSVLFYTQVSSKNDNGGGGRVNSILGSTEERRHSNSNNPLGQIIRSQGSSSSSSSNTLSSSSSSSPGQLNTIPARSFYLDNLRLPSSNSNSNSNSYNNVKSLLKPLPLVLNYSS